MRTVIAAFVLIVTACSSVFAEDLQEAKFEKWNFKVSFSPKWEAAESGNQLITLALQRGPNEAILVSAHEDDSPLDALVKTFESESELRPDKLKEIERNETKIGGERAVVVKTSSQRGGAKFTMYVAIFGHQGIAYRIVGVSVKDDERFQGDLHDFFSNFAFLKQREEWLKKYEGTPAVSTMLGGLVRFELNKPRWKEDTFTDKREYDFDEQAAFGFVTGGAWVNLRVRHTTGSAAIEAREMKQQSQVLYKNLKDLPPPPVKDSNAQTYAFSGEYGGYKRLIHGAAMVQDGIAVRLTMETLDSQAEVMRKDWDKLLASLKFQKPGELLPAYSIERQNRAHYRNSNPDVARIVAIAEPLLKSPKHHQLRAISPDGTRAILQARAALFIEDLSTHKSDPLNIGDADLAGSTHFAWSPDGNSVAGITEAGVTIIKTAPGSAAQTIAVQCDEATFVPGGSEMLLCVPIVTDVVQTYQPFSSNRLEAVKIGDDKSRRTLQQFPLSKFALPVYSPDGKQLALACNRDCIRSDREARHVYVCSAGGGELKQLTREPEHILSLAWSPDGQWIYAVRALLDSDEPNQYREAFGDVYRISVASGQAENLTKCGKISRAWAAGDDLLLQINNWSLDEEQTGLFRVKVKDLAAATAALPEPARTSNEARIAKVAEAVLKAGGKKAIKDKLTLDLIKKCAGAFAESASREFQIKLDFTRGSLDLLASIMPRNSALKPEVRAYMLGFGAYYGETLCKDGAEWDIEPQPFGDWLPSHPVEGNNLVDVVLPFSDSWNVMMNSEYAYLRGKNDINTREQGQKILLVYPSTHAAEALKKATGSNYLEAIKKVDSGNVEGGLQLMTRELQLRPRNRQLATSVISLCKAAGMPELATKLTKEAVEGGNEVPDLLISYADSIAATDQKKAIEYYRKATSAQWGTADAFIKLGKAYAAAGEPAVAESCWRQAYWQAPKKQRTEIMKLMKIDGKPTDIDDDLDFEE